MFVPPAPNHVAICVFVPHREGLIFLHNGASCAPDYEKAGLGGYMAFPDMYAFVTIDTEHANKVFLSLPSRVGNLIFDLRR